MHQKGQHHCLICSLFQHKFQFLSLLFSFRCFELILIHREMILNCLEGIITQPNTSSWLLKLPGDLLTRKIRKHIDVLYSTEYSHSHMSVLWKKRCYYFHILILPTFISFQNTCLLPSLNCSRFCFHHWFLTYDSTS